MDGLKMAQSRYQINSFWRLNPLACIHFRFQFLEADTGKTKKTSLSPASPVLFLSLAIGVNTTSEDHLQFTDFMLSSRSASTLAEPHASTS
jgi:hypothetical protein